MEGVSQGRLTVHHNSSLNSATYIRKCCLLRKKSNLHTIQFPTEKIILTRSLIKQWCSDAPLRLIKTYPLKMHLHSPLRILIKADYSTFYIQYCKKSPMKSEMLKTFLKGYVQDFLIFQVLADYNNAPSYSRSLLSDCGNLSLPPYFG